MGTPKKPVHIITHNQDFHHILLHYNIEVEAISETDFTENGRPHWHILALWPLTTDHYGRVTLNPARTTILQRWRRLYGCEQCKTKKGQAYCNYCGLNIKFKWLRGPEHHKNVREYIQRRISEPGRERTAQE